MNQIYNQTLSTDWEEIRNLLHPQGFPNKGELPADIDKDKFLDTLYPILASIKCVTNDKGLYSASETIKGMPENITTPYGSMSKKNMQYLLLVLSETKRSLLLNGTLSSEKNRRFSTLVPLFLAAQKHYNNILYKEWDKSDSKFAKLIGYQLKPILGLTNKDFTSDEIIRERTRCMREDRPLTSTISKWPIFGKTKYKGWDIAPVIAMQVWLANSEIRHEDMILDFDDWDKVPEALDNPFATITNTEFDPDNPF